MDNYNNDTIISNANDVVEYLRDGNTEGAQEVLANLSPEDAEKTMSAIQAASPAFYPDAMKIWGMLDYQETQHAAGAYRNFQDADREFRQNVDLKDDKSIENYEKVSETNRKNLEKQTECINKSSRQRNALINAVVGIAAGVATTAAAVVTFKFLKK